MKETLRISIEQIAVDRDAVLENQKIPRGQPVSAETDTLYDTACRMLQDTAAPAGVLASISGSDFSELYSGEGRNELPTPVEDIYRSADVLVLFAVTLGPAVSVEIESLFKANDFAIGCMLDSAASVAADTLANMSAAHAKEMACASGKTRTSATALCYSPGYCGWHISGQKKLFAYLDPQQVGMTLRDSYLMEPLKSVSGVIIVGPPEIHDFNDTYSFCSACETHGCRERLRALLGD